ncbi:MAG: NACHT domain-containing protein [Kouleothrix sp.]|nr:NACHT domain-containing protein [Kouleothrix sp.]
MPSWMTGRAPLHSTSLCAVRWLRFANPIPTIAPPRVLALLQQDEAALRQFRQIAVEELVLSAQPNLGRLLDHYRHEVRFLSLLCKQDLPPWQEIEPGLRLFFGDLLPRAIADQPMLRPLLLEQAEIQALDQMRAATHAAEDSSAALRRIEALVEELVALPKVTQSLGAEGGATISGVQQVIARNYYAAPELAKPDLARLYRRYCAFLAETYGRLNFSGILQMQQFGVLRLEDVYVPLSGRAQRQPGDRYFDTLRQRPSLPLLTAPFSVRNPTRTEPAPPLHNLVRDTALLVVLGDPGAGKSTLVRYLMLSLVEGFAGERLGLVDEWLPILLPVAAFADARAKTPDLAPMDYLSAYYTGLSQPDYGPLFRRALLGGRALVLIDGLDEVREQRREIVHCLEAFVREWDAPGNRFVATSRIAGYDEAPLDDALFLRVDTQQLDDDGIRLFAAKWSLAIERAGTQPSERDRQVVEAEICRRADGRRLSLCSAVFANPGVTELARNPLLLTILALIHNQGTRLPDRRVELYRLCVETLAETWNRARSLSRREA